MSRRVVYTRSRYRGTGVVYSAECHACDATLIRSWRKGEVRAIGRRHERECHR